MSRNIFFYPVSSFEGRSLPRRGGPPVGHAVYWHKAETARGWERLAHFESLCGAWPKGQSSSWSDRACDVTCPKCLDRLAKMRAQSERSAEASAKEKPGDPACECRGWGCCACLAALPPCHTCADCAHVGRCKAFGFTSSEENPYCSFIPSRFRLALVTPGASGAGGEPSFAYRPKRERDEAPAALAGEGGAA